jgi:hypothetical protein
LSDILPDQSRPCVLHVGAQRPKPSGSIMIFKCGELLSVNQFDVVECYDQTCSVPPFDAPGTCGCGAMWRTRRGEQKRCREEIETVGIDTRTSTPGRFSGWWFRGWRIRCGCAEAGRVVFPNAARLPRQPCMRHPFSQTDETRD